MSSSIPGAVAYFLQLAGTALPASAYVYFGVELPKYTAPVTLQVTGITGNQQPAELGPSYKREETYSILCELTSFAGDQDFPTRLSEVMDNWALITVAVAGDPTLGGNVRFAECGDMDFSPKSDIKGFSLGSLTFDVRCSQRITSLT